MRTRPKTLLDVARDVAAGRTKRDEVRPGIRKAIDRLVLDPALRPLVHESPKTRPALDTSVNARFVGTHIRNVRG